MNNASGKINKYALSLEEAQNQIRLIVKNAFFNYEPFNITERKIQKVIESAIKEIKISRLKRDSYYALINFATVQRQQWKSIGLTPLAVLYLGKLASKDFKTIIAPSRTELTVKREILALSDTITTPPTKTVIDERRLTYATKDKGVPLAKFYGDVWKEKVKPTLDRLCETTALDPNDLTGRNSLRNLAEMEVRYQDHIDNINELKDKGVKIVICSAHEDCSERCYKWQKQRFYSLDGSEGDIDGYHYIPLERATDVYYTTKAGRRYKNGLLGFNCRHYLIEYKGELIPTVSAKTRAIEYGITKKQRAMERAVRQKRIEAETLKGINEQAYKEARAEAIRLNKEYQAYSHKHNRAYYPMRVKI